MSRKRNVQIIFWVTEAERDMIERAARDRLGYVYRGELVFKQK